MADSNTATPFSVTPQVKRGVSTRRTTRKPTFSPDHNELGFGTNNEINSKLKRELQRIKVGSRYGKRHNEEWGLVNHSQPYKKQCVESPIVDTEAAAASRAHDMAFLDTSSSSDDDNDHQTAESNVQTSRLVKVPPPMRVIVEHEGISQLVQDNTMCVHCKEPGTLKLQFNVVCVAAKPKLVCINCNKAGVEAEVDRTVFSAVSPDGKKTKDRMKDLSTNLCFVTSFTASGDGGREAQRFCTLMGLPNVTTMEKTSFRELEDALWPAVQKIVQQAMNETLFEEVRRSMLSDPHFNFDVWQHCYENQIPLPDNCKRPVVKVGMDMGWNNRGGSGRKYDSKSGHAILVGFFTRKAIQWSIKSRHCSYCLYVQRKGIENKPHVCLKNHEGSAGSMECQALLDMVTNLFDEYKTEVGLVITDDDSTMQAQCKWSNEDYMKNNNLTEVPIVGWTKPRSANSQPKPIFRTSGSLRGDIPAPDFFADPAHRKKTLRNELWTLLKKGKFGSYGMHEGDIVRLELNFIYMVRQLSDLPESEYEKRGKAVLEHHFDNHEYCSEKWCKRKSETEEQRSLSTKQYRCKVKNKNLYLSLKSVVDKYVTKERLVECAHGSDTQVNESMNNTISWFAPKNKTYSGSLSLQIRIGMAVAINILGEDVFFASLYEECGITMSDVTLHGLHVQQTAKENRYSRERTNSARKERMQKTYAKIRAHHDQIKSDKENGRSYESGVRMKAAANSHGRSDTVHGVVLDVSENNDSVPLSSVTAAPVKQRRTYVCPLCSISGHKTNKSTKCLFYKKQVPSALIDREGNGLSSEALVAETIECMDKISLSSDGAGIANLVSEIDSIDEEASNVLSKETGVI